MSRKQRKSNVTIITPLLSGKGGTETVLFNILNNVEYTSGYKINLFVLGDKNKNVWVDKLPNTINIKFFSEGRNWKIILLFFNLVLSRNDRLICLSTKILFFSYLIKIIFKKKFILFSWIHFSLLNEKTVDISKLKYADYHLAISTGIFNQLKSLGISDDKIKLIYNPVDKKEKLISSSKSRKVKLIYIGRILLNDQKNLKELFDSLRYFEEYTVDVGIYGSGQIDECKGYIKKNGINQNFFWHGWINNPWNDIKNADITVLTSNYEGFPMVLLESISYGIPVVSSDCPTGPDDIVEPSNGYIYKLGDPEDLANKIKLLKKKELNREVVKKSIEKFYTDRFIDNFWNDIFNLK